MLMINTAKFYKLAADENLIPINENVVFTIKDMGNFSYQIQIFNNFKDLLYSKTIDENLNHFIDN